VTAAEEDPTAMSDPNVDERLARLESRLGRLESLLERVSDRLERDAVDLDGARAGIERWVTEYVSVRLQQLVPHGCEHEPSETAEGPVLPGTRIRCTDEVLHRLGRIPIPFVRQMVTQKVADTARAENVPLVDVAFFERSATF
jgi:hypothetical protein